jgi:hypothetical protein
VRHYFFGDDTFEARRAIEDLARERGASLCWLDREDLEQRSLAHWFGWGSGALFGVQLCVVRDASQFPKGLQEDILAVKDLKLGTDYVIWDRGLPPKNSLIFQRLRNSSRRFSLSSHEQVRQWAVQEARKRGGMLEEAAARLLVERVGIDKWRLL